MHSSLDCVLGKLANQRMSYQDIKLIILKYYKWTLYFHFQNNRPLICQMRTNIQNTVKVVKKCHSYDLRALNFFNTTPQNLRSSYQSVFWKVFKSQKIEFEFHNSRLLSQRAEFKLQKRVLNAESCRKTKTIAEKKLKLKLKYEVNLRFETQIWKPGPNLKIINLEMRSWIPGLL